MEVGVSDVKQAARTADTFFLPLKPEMMSRESETPFKIVAVVRVIPLVVEEMGAAVNASDAAEARMRLAYGEKASFDEEMEVAAI